MDDRRYDQRYAEARRRLDAAGVPRWVGEPPWLRLLRKLGLRPVPPHYAAFSTNLMAHGFVFALLWGVFMWLVAWREAVPVQAAAVTALLIGVLFGLVMAFLYRATAERKNLGRWESLPDA